MESFYQNVPPEAAAEIEQITRLMYEIRCARDEVLSRLGATDTARALERIVTGELPEHPGYEDYLSARILADLHGQVRADLAARIEEVRGK
jgi:hypothetical protein